MFFCYVTYCWDSVSVNDIGFLLTMLHNILKFNLCIFLSCNIYRHQISMDISELSPRYFHSDISVF